MVVTRNLSTERPAGSNFYHCYPLDIYLFYLILPVGQRLLLLLSPFADKKTEVQSGYVTSPSDGTKTDKSHSTPSRQTASHRPSGGRRGSVVFHYSKLLFHWVPRTLQSDLSFRFAPHHPPQCNARGGSCRVFQGAWSRSHLIWN